MEHEFWHARWAEGRIGFHQQKINEMLRQYWPQAVSGRVLVPLCGKSSDMCWLRAQGCDVLGVELSESACQSFFAENDLAPEITEQSSFRSYAVDGLELLCGDVFALTAERLADVRWLYDRAALIALPPEMRVRYAALLCEKLPVGAEGVLITMEFEGEQGPPFSVSEADVRALFEGRFEVERLGRIEESPGRADVAYRLRDRQS